MSKLSDMSTFQLALLIFFGSSAVVMTIVLAFFQESSKSSSIKLTLEMWGVISDVEVVENWIENVLPEKEGVAVSYRYIPIENFYRIFLESHARGQSPDILLISHDQIFPKRDWIYKIPFDFFPERQFRDTFAPVTEVFIDRNEGLVYGLPVLIDPLVMYWNRQLVRQTGIIRPPNRWSDFNDFTQKTVRREGGKITMSSVALGEYQNIEHAKEIISTLIFQAGGGVLCGDVSELKSCINEKYGFAIKPAISSMLFYMDFSDADRSSYSWDKSMSNSLRAFTDESLIVYFGLASDVRKIKKMNPFLDFDVALVPENENDSPVSYGRVYGLALVEKSRNSKLSDAYAAVLNLASAPALKKLSEDLNGFPPSRNDLLYHPPEKFFYAPVFYDSARKSFSWINPDRQTMDNIFMEMIKSIASRELDVNRAITRANSQIKSNLE